MNVEHTPERGTYALSTQMAEDYTPPSSSLNPAATLDKVVIDDYEARFREYEDKVHSLAADLLEERQKRRDEEGQRREVAAALVRVTEERDRLAEENLAVHIDLAEELHSVDDLRAQLDDAQATASMRAQQRDEARDENRRLRDRLRFADESLRLKKNTVRSLSESVSRAQAENVRLRTIIGELGAAEAAEPQDGD